MRKSSIEDSELIAFFDWLRWQEKLNPVLKVVHHVPNEGKTTLAGGARKKRKGCRAGIPDISCPIPSGEYHGLYIEMKRDKNQKPSAAQKEILAILHSLGHCVRMAYSGEQAIKIFKDYLALANTASSAPN